MKVRLLDFLLCPLTRTKLNLEVEEETRIPLTPEQVTLILKVRTLSNHPARHLSDADYIASFERHVLKGTLKSTSNQTLYPIENGIPVILPPELRTTRGAMGRSNPATDTRLKEFLDDQKIIQKNEHDKFLTVQLANQSNYGYEWKAFSHEQKAWQEIYRKYYVLEDDQFFEGKLGLDAGCGMGRYPLVAASKGAEMIGIDLSNAIEAAYTKSLSNPLFHALQGDIFNLPFEDGQFDFAQTLGVIHITPDPETALQCIKTKVNSNGKLWLYVYPSFKDENRLRYWGLKVVSILRRITVKLPSNILFGLLAILAPFIWFFLLLPSRILDAIGFSKIARVLPYNCEQYKNRGIRDVHMNLFDRFGNPAERRYDRQEIIQWMDRAGFSKYEVFFKDGWTVSALR